ncbi:MAG TPA: DUF3341 domain-containing protein [Lacunisphaera sp.]|jgi:hypothetical protein|nr:DUF3341 domain-containing protein [Lacunisphaera sp.]
MSAARNLLAGFAEHDQLVRALRRLRELGCTRLEVYAPFPSREVDELLPGRPTPAGWLMLAGGMLGGSGAYFLQWYAAHDYAYNVGGRPLHSWPSFVPVTFELTVLCAALTGLVALLVLTRLPRLDHPVFAEPAFVRASQDRFFLAVHTADPHLAAIDVADLLRGFGAERIEEVGE